MAFGRILNENVSNDYLLKDVDINKDEKVIDEENLVSINESEFSGWKERLIQALNKLIIEKNLPANSLCLMANKSRQNDAITSYSVCIYEPDLIEDKRAFKNYSPKASSFACCARYEQCSDAKKCIHANQLYSKACEYRKNLESGKIFYGKNKNI